MPARDLPYPPAPKDAPEHLVEYSDAHRAKERVLLAGLLLFLLFYFAVIVLLLLITTYCIVWFRSNALAKAAVLFICASMLFYMLKAFFRRPKAEREVRVEIFEEEQPRLFAFIDRVCREVDAPLPGRVFIAAEVTAAVLTNGGLATLVRQPKRDLLIGLGLVACENLSEFKATLAHEFGHVRQSGFINSYSHLVHVIAYNLVSGEDAFDRWVKRCRQEDNGFTVLFIVPLVPLLIGRWLVNAAFRVCALQRLAVSREREFHADRVAVAAAGSDALCSALMRLDFGHLCQMQALEDLTTAADHGLYSPDIFLHQDRAEAVVRRRMNEPKLGERIPPPDSDEAEDHRLFDPDHEEIRYDEVHEYHRTHPPNHEREENAKRWYLPAKQDERSPWILFTNAAELKERVSFKYCRFVLNGRKNLRFASRDEVQKFIDDEHSETLLDPKHRGVWEGRMIDPGDLDRLDEELAKSPWTPNGIVEQHQKLYAGAEDRNEECQELKKQKATIESTPGAAPGMQRRLRMLGREINTHLEWFRELDQRVWLCHMNMAAAVSPALQKELAERWRFGVQVQRFHQTLREHEWKVVGLARHCAENTVTPEQLADFMQTLRKAWHALKKVVKEAGELNMPAMKNFEEGERLADFVLEKRLVAEPYIDPSQVRWVWLEKFHEQLRSVRVRCGRLHAKSVGGILALQDRVAAAWFKAYAPQHAPAESAPPEPAADAKPAPSRRKPVRKPKRDGSRCRERFEDDERVDQAGAKHAWFLLAGVLLILLTGSILGGVAMAKLFAKKDTAPTQEDDDPPLPARPRQPGPRTMPGLPPAPDRGPDPIAGAKYLVELAPFNVVDGPWPVSLGHNGSGDRTPIVLKGRPSPRGIGMHAPDAGGRAEASFPLDRGFRTLRGAAGLQDWRSETFSPVQFTILADGKAIWESGNVTRRGGPVAFDLDVSGVRTLTLQVRSTGFHVNAHAVWFEPRLEN